MATARRGEAGTVLVLFALLLVGVFGLLGAVVDGGRLRLVKQQLDAGAESAALEGVRYKDRSGDSARRGRALSALARQWDDDLDASNGDLIGLGAGALPVVTGSMPLGGSIDVAATGAARAWKPAEGFEQNLGNAAYGDMVSGVHLAGGAAREDDAFQRLDFDPAAVGSSSTVLAAAPAFLVRLRRATGRLALDRQPGQSSAGPPLDWLWARGSAWQEPGAGSGQSRSDGMTIRAASIASTERALLVSADPVGGSPLLAPFALRGDAAAAWQATGAGASLTLDIAANGALTVAGAEQGVALAGAASRVGDAVPLAGAALAVVSADELIVAVYAQVNGQRLVVGFTLATAALTGAAVTVTRRASAVLPAGASSVSPAALDARLALEQSPSLAALHAAFAEPVLAPVLRR